MRYLRSIFILFLIPFMFAACGGNSNTMPETTTSATNTSSSSKTTTTAELHTNLGVITIRFFDADAPKTVQNFVKLANEHFYDGVLFHRVIPDFMIQTGDPNSKDDDWSTHGRGGPGYTFDDEINQHKIVRGAVAMANAGPDTNGSQFFIVTAASTPWLDGKHTVFGEVTGGMDVATAIEKVKTNENDHPLEDVIIESIVITKSD